MALPHSSGSATGILLSRSAGNRGVPVTHKNVLQDRVADGTIAPTDIGDTRRDIGQQFRRQKGHFLASSGNAGWFGKAGRGGRKGAARQDLTPTGSKRAKGLEPSTLTLAT